MKTFYQTGGIVHNVQSFFSITTVSVSRRKQEGKMEEYEMQARTKPPLSVNVDEDAGSSPTRSDDLGKRASGYIRSKEDQDAIDQTRIKV